MTKQSQGYSGLAKAALRVLPVFALIAVSLAVSAPTASAMTCPYDTANHTSNVTFSSTDYSVTIRANGAYLEIAGVFCGLLSDVNTVNINASASPTIDLNFDLTNGPLGPGYTDEGNGSSEIEFSVTGLSSTSQLSVRGTDASEKITLGWLLNRFSGYSAGQINLNALADGATVDNDISFPNLPGSTRVLTYGGDDVISAAGTGTLYTGPAIWPLFIDGGLGSNQLTGGSGNDRRVVRRSLPAGRIGHDLGGRRIRLGPRLQHRVRRCHPRFDLARWGGQRRKSLPWHGVQRRQRRSRHREGRGSGAAENILGNSAGQEFDGGGGADLVQGLGGNDTFTCNSGTYEGGAGADAIRDGGLEVRGRLRNHSRWPGQRHDELWLVLPQGECHSRQPVQ